MPTSSLDRRQPARVARASHEALQKKKKLARVAAAQQRLAVDEAVRVALRRAARPRAELLRDALGARWDQDRFTGPLRAFRSALALLRTVEDAAAYAAAADVVCAVEAQAPSLALVEVGEYGLLGRGIARLAACADRFVRPVSTWTSPRRQPERVWQSLVAHVVHRFKTPAAWSVVFTDNCCPQELRRFVVDVGNGASWRSAKLPTFITRAVAHALGTPEVELDSAVGLVRDAQCRALGVSLAHRQVVRQHDELDDFLDDDIGLEGVFAFFARHPELPGDDVKMVCDAMVGCEGRLPSMKGRTPKSLLTMCREMIRDKQQRDAGRLDVGVFPEPVVAGGAYVLVDDKSFESPTFVVEPIRTGRQLIEEGIAMRHCVGTYAERARSGEVIIFGVRTEVDGGARKRALTIEVKPESRAVIQVRGRCNRGPTRDEVGIVRCWAKEQGLRLPF